MDLKEELSKVKILLIGMKKLRFIQSIIFNSRFYWTNEVATAATDGINIMFNPEFFKELKKEERAFVLCHEAWHIALSHMSRVGTRDRRIWNYAGDYVINDMLINAGLPMPSKGLHDYKYSGMSTEQVYELIKNDPPEADEDYDDIIYDKHSPEEKEEIENEVKKLLIKAANELTITKDYGSIPGEILRTIDELINPKLSWQELLQRFVDNIAKDDYSWKKPNKRYMPSYMPSMYSEVIDNITVAIDTSGSISNEQLQSILSEIGYINSTVKPKTMTILDCDYTIHHVHEVDDSMDITSLEFSGCGGTAIEPVLDHCDNNNTNVLIYFTDGYYNQVETEPDYPSLWVIYGNDKYTSPIGETIHIHL